MTDTTIQLARFGTTSRSYSRPPSVRSSRSSRSKVTVEPKPKSKGLKVHDKHSTTFMPLVIDDDFFEDDDDPVYETLILGNEQSLMVERQQDDGGEFAMALVIFILLVIPAALIFFAPR